MMVGVLSIFKKIAGEFFPKKGEVIMKEQFTIVAYLYVCKPKKYYNLRYKSNKFQYIP